MKHTAIAAAGAMLLLAGTQAGLAAQSDETFLKTAIGINLAEIQTGQLAQKNGSGSGIRDFGSMLVTDHSASNRDAMAIAEKLGITIPNAPSGEDQAMYKDLAGKTGSDFDHAFAQAMVDGHQKAIKLFTDESNSGTGDAKAYAAKTLPTLNKHLASAQTLLDNPNATAMNQNDGAMGVGPGAPAAGATPNATAMNQDGGAGAPPSATGINGNRGAGATPGASAAANTPMVEPDKITANDLKSATVYDANNRKIGSVSDVVLTKDGKIDAVVLDVGGFLGIGTKSVALAFDDLQFRRDSGNYLYVYSKFTQKELEQAPNYDKKLYDTHRDSMRLHSASASP